MCALDELIDSRHSDIVSSSAHPSRKQLHSPQCGSVCASQVGVSIRVVQGTARPGAEEAACPEQAANSAEGQSHDGTSCPESDRYLNSHRFSSCSDLHTDKRRLGPTSQTRPSGDLCSKITTSSSPRRSVGFRVFVFKSRSIVLACSFQGQDR